MNKFRFYCPLKAGTWEGFDGEELQYAEEMRSVDPWAYEDEIREAVKRENEILDEGGLAPYIHETDLQTKVKNIMPCVEVIGNDLYGVMDIELNADLSPEELENLLYIKKGLKNMANAKIIITFDSEKLAAIRQFAEDDTQYIDTALREQLEKIYAKAVPAPVRQYIEGKAKTKPKPPSKPDAPPNNAT